MMDYDYYIKAVEWKLYMYFVLYCKSYCLVLHHPMCRNCNYKACPHYPQRHKLTWHFSVSICQYSIIPQLTTVMTHHIIYKVLYSMILYTSTSTIIIHAVELEVTFCIIYPEWCTNRNETLVNLFWVKVLINLS